MHKNEYITILKQRISNIPKDEAENIIRYYSEYFDEAGIENEQDVIKELGSPESLARKAAADYIIRDYESDDDMYKKKTDKETDKKRSTFSDIGIILAAVFSSVIWFPLGLAALIVVFCLFVSMGAVVFALGVCCIAFVFSSIVLVISGIILLFINFPSGILNIGQGLIMIGTGILFIFITRIAAAKLKALFMYVSAKIIRRKKK